MAGSKDNKGHGITGGVSKTGYEALNTDPSQSTSGCPSASANMWRAFKDGKSYGTLRRAPPAETIGVTSWVVVVCASTAEVKQTKMGGPARRRSEIKV
jgi:hypothetical protein